MTTTSPTKTGAGSSKTRKQRPNYNYIHRNLLPVETYPLPPLIPHNPLSLVAIALTYLTHVLVPPKRSIYNGYFSSDTSSIHVTDPVAIRALWEMGFFGRGSLSRSEPNWLKTQKQKGMTAEENTRQRRNERRELKLQRAKLEQEEIAKQLLKENKDGSSSSESDPHLDSNVSKTRVNDISAEQTPSSSHSNDVLPVVTEDHAAQMNGWKTAVMSNGLLTPPPTTASSESDQVESRPIKKLQRSKSVRFSPTIEAREFDLTSPVISPIKAPGSSSGDIADEPTQLEEKEHLNLSLEEAFFLTYGLGVLNIYCENTETILPPSSLLSLFRRQSHSPARSLSAPIEPDDPFMLSYAVYHHYRSLGWIVRSGVKFSTDFLLYNRGPAFSHAEFAIVIIPSYNHKYWSDTKSHVDRIANETKKSWWWLHGVNRVQAQVHKHLVLCYVEVPPPIDKHKKGPEIDIGYELGRYKIRDIGLKRWTPNRSRD